MKGKPTIEKCKFCGLDVHQSQFLVCDTYQEYPLPYKISVSIKPKNTKNTEPLKLITEDYENNYG